VIETQLLELSKFICLSNLCELEGKLRFVEEVQDEAKDARKKIEDNMTEFKVFEERIQNEIKESNYKIENLNFS